MRSASVKPQIAPGMFPVVETAEPDIPHQSNMSKRRVESPETCRKKSATSEDFGDDGIDDEELAQISFDHLDFDHIDNYVDSTKSSNRPTTARKSSLKPKQQSKNYKDSCKSGAVAAGEEDKPVQLANGKWACNHRCKDKTSCKHLCCKEGTDNPPKKKTSTAKRVPSGEEDVQQVQDKTDRKGKNTQTKLQLLKLKRKVSASIEELDLTQQEKRKKTQNASDNLNDLRGLQQLHRHVQGNTVPSSLQPVSHTKPAYCYSQGGAHDFNFMNQQPDASSRCSSQYGHIQYDEEFSNHISAQRNIYQNHNNHPAAESYGNYGQSRQDPRCF